MDNGKVSSKKSAQGCFFAGGGLAYHTSQFQGDNSFTAAGNANSFSPFVSLGFDAFQNPYT